MVDNDRKDIAATEETDVVARLIRSAGRRPEPPASEYRRTFAIATAALTRKRAARRRRQSLFLLAASVAVAAIAVAVYLPLSPRPVQQVAEVERVIGAVEWSPSLEAGWQPARESAALTPGSRLRSLAGSRVGLVLAGGASVRIAPGTEVELESTERLRLREGMLYVDSSAADAGI